MDLKTTSPGAKNEAQQDSAFSFAGMRFAKNAAARGYRPDIDGLRAIAVAVVVIYHTGVSPLRGGFIGVDIFFVISGFLISGLLVKDIERGTFSLKGFYERRIRRILPAMLAMLAIVLAVSPLLLFASELQATAMTALASLLSAANLYLLSASGYFEADSGTRPLLHMWSLGVEEQFYLAFPLVLMLIGRGKPGRMLQVVLALTLASFAASVIISHDNRDLAYFLPLTRAWELLAGALLVVLPLPLLSRWLRELAAAFALLLIAVSVMKIHSGMAFPGYIALLPCAAAAILIAVGSQGGSFVSRILALPPMVFTGKLSYSLYLWHWPIFVGYKLFNGGTISIAEAVLLVAVALVVAWLSWRFVEGPFRDKHLLPTRKGIFTGAALVTVILAAGTAVLFINAARPPRDEAGRLAGYLTYDDTPVYRRGTCFLLGHMNSVADYQPESCLSPQPGKRNILVMGDSHAAHLWSGLQGALPDDHVMQTTVTGCKPVLDSAGEATCTTLMSSTFDRLGADLKPDILILSARWIEGDIAALTRTLEALRSKVKTIIVSGPITEYAMPLPRLLAQIAGGRNAALLDNARNRDVAGIDAALNQAVTASGARYFSPYRLLCPQDGAACLTTLDSVPVQWDYGHLTGEGSRLVGEAMRKDGLFQQVP